MYIEWYDIYIYMHVISKKNASQFYAEMGSLISPTIHPRLVPRILGEWCQRTTAVSTVAYMAFGASQGRAHHPAAEAEAKIHLNINGVPSHFWRNRSFSRVGFFSRICHDLSRLLIWCFIVICFPTLFASFLLDWWDKQSSLGPLGTLLDRPSKDFDLLRQGHFCYRIETPYFRILQVELWSFDQMVHYQVGRKDFSLFNEIREMEQFSSVTQTDRNSPTDGWSWWSTDILLIYYWRRF